MVSTLGVTRSGEPAEGSGTTVQLADKLGDTWQLLPLQFLRVSTSAKPEPADVKLGKVVLQELHATPGFRKRYSYTHVPVPPVLPEAALLRVKVWPAHSEATLGEIGKEVGVVGCDTISNEL